MDKKPVRKILIVVLWLLVWELLSLIVNNKILMAGPVETLMSLVSMMKTPDLYLSLLDSFIRIAGGFLLGTFLGIAAACASYKSRFVRDLIGPVAGLIKAVPVASFVILLLIWAGRELVSLVICTLIVFPIVYINALEGLDSTDRALLEMADVYRMKAGSRIRYIYIPALKPFLNSSLSLASGMSFKGGVAAEVIGRPLRSIGTGIYGAKLLLDTGELFAWTFLAIVLAFVFEKAVKLVMRRIG